VPYPSPSGADYRGSALQLGIRSLRGKPGGALWELFTSRFKLKTINIVADHSAICHPSSRVGNIS